MIRLSVLAILALPAAVAGKQSSALAAEDGTGLALRSVVMLMRHGVRPPTSTKAITPLAAQPWPDFGVPDGQLTPHGRQALMALGQWERRYWASLGLLSAKGWAAGGPGFEHVLCVSADTSWSLLILVRPLLTPLPIH